MDAESRNRSLICVAIIILILSFAANLRVVFSSSSGGKIDIFTQREPYSGKGANMSSDAFTLDQEVNIFALTTYYDWPEVGINVAFQIIGPKNPIENITFCRIASTNESGIAMISFRIPNSNETTFGEWTVIGSVRIVDSIVQDIVLFKVCWIVEIVSIRTINEEYLEQKSFPRKSTLGIELVLQNIALTHKNATLTISLYDSIGVIINSTEVTDVAIQPDGVLYYFHYFLQIPGYAHIGNATIYACAYTVPISLGGIPYCPEVSSGFQIIRESMHDIAIIAISPSSNFVFAGDIVDVNATVKNLGNFTESFNITLFYTHLVTTEVVNTLFVDGLGSGAERTLVFHWDTENVSEGNYTLSALASQVDGEENLDNNHYVDGFVEVKVEVEPMFHDVAVLNVMSSSASVYVGESNEVYVVVGNKGNWSESFTVTVFYDSNVFGELFVDGLGSGAERTLVFHWDTENVSEGNYTLSALASQVDGEENLDNNHYVDGFVEVKVEVEPMFHDVAVLNVMSSSASVYVGESNEVYVVVGNKGNWSESFTVTVFYDSNVFGELFVDGLGSGAERTLVFHWDTENVSEGNYTLSALASQVDGEENLDNNHYVDGFVNIVALDTRADLYIHDWLFWLLLLLLIVMIALLIIWLDHKRRKNKAKEAFYSAWTAWYGRERIQ